MGTIGFVVDDEKALKCCAIPVEIFDDSLGNIDNSNVQRELSTGNFRVASIPLVSHTSPRGLPLAIVLTTL